MGANDNLFVHTYSAGGERNYTIAYDKQLYTTYWVAYPLNSSHSGSLDRASWRYATELDNSYQVDLREHSYNDGYSRGHLIPNASRNGIEEMQDQTFFVINSVPQIQNGFNGSVWNSLENAVRGYAANEEIYVVSGAVLNKVGESKTVNHTTAKDDTTKNVPVPNYYYKLVLKIEKSGSTVTSASTIGFWFEHKEYSSDSYTNYTVSVDQVEAWTGYDFFANLPAAVESNAEANTNLSTFVNF